MTRRHAAIRQTEEHLLNAWPSLRTVVSAGWVLREARGYTKRANSACALSARGAFAPALRAAEHFYAAFDRPAIFRLTPLAAPACDATLAKRGYTKADETIVMAMPLRAHEIADASFSCSPSRTSEWEHGYADTHRLNYGERDAHHAILDRIAPLPTAYAIVHHDGRAIAFGLGVVERDRLGLFDIVTKPEARRRGAARAVVQGLLAWGARQGAQSVWLSMLADNCAAAPLYSAFGFRELYRYHYRVGPQR